MRLAPYTLLTAEPHDSLHLASDLVLSEVVDEQRQGEDVERPSDEAEDQGPDYQGRLHLVLEAEYRQTQVREHTRLWNTRQGQ